MQKSVGFSIFFCGCNQLKFVHIVLILDGAKVVNKIGAVR
jgi:hypothetical protein